MEGQHEEASEPERPSLGAAWRLRLAESVGWVWGMTGSHLSAGDRARALSEVKCQRSRAGSWWMETGSQAT